jgi:hypothetical protein
MKKITIVTILLLALVSVGCVNSQSMQVQIPRQLAYEVVGENPLRVGIHSDIPMPIILVDKATGENDLPVGAEVLSEPFLKISGVARIQSASRYEIVLVFYASEAFRGDIWLKELLQSPARELGIDPITQMEKSEDNFMVIQANTDPSKIKERLKKVSGIVLVLEQGDLSPELKPNELKLEKAKLIPWVKIIPEVEKANRPF